ncbi:MAG: ornithine cyclodeaminase family protein [Calditrichaeota bacterium]|nr:MAG: ornithine cyclodeaminase family protein [Calditrichota bacterium]MBL1206475.1 ornithine cyclodeaminase family protein [Calditrichota bacterium]NOG46302.1 ornithine cyclodeaminase family protein [Calditrichota bacterium]
MLIINEQDIESAVAPLELVGAIEKAYLIQDKKSTQIPDRMHINSAGNTLLVMPGFIESAFGTKLVSLFPENKKLNKPVLSGVMILNDSQTGEPLALINGAKLTAMRTGAVGATAVKHLSQNSAKTFGIIGAGVQAYHQALIVGHVQPFQKLLVCDKEWQKAEQLKNKLDSKLENIKIEYTVDPDKLVLNSDVIITTTTSNTPVFDADVKNLKNKTFIGIGSYKPDMQEFPLQLFGTVEKVYVDTPFAKEECGDLKIPIERGILKEHNVLSFSALLTKKQSLNKTSIRLFKSVGMSLFDLTVAELIFNNAKEKNLGTEVQI